MNLQDIVNELKQEGFSNSTAWYHGRKLYSEQYGNEKDKYTDEERQWAYQHGFLAEEARCLSLNDTNYKKYLSSHDYHLLDPIDPFTKRLVDGKLVIPYTIGGKYPQYLPKYYGWILNANEVIPMNDNPIDKWDSVEDYLKKLLDIKKCLAVKPYTGAGGVGFVKLEKIEDEYYCNGEYITNFDEFVQQISDKYLVTEYIKQCRELDEVWKNSAATIRVVAINKNAGPKIFVSYIRFGTLISKGVSNLTSGGVAAPFDWETGKYMPNFYRYIKYCKDGNYILNRHPDSGVSLQGKSIPYFENVKQLVYDICSFLSIHSYFGFDIMITDEGAKICEINSHPSMEYEQLMFGGIFEQDHEVVTFFKDLLEKNKK